MSESRPVIGNIFFTVPDVEVVVPFYRDVVGLPVKFQDGTEWVAFDGGGCTVALSKGEVRGPTPSLKVQDLDAWIAGAKRAGGEPGPIEVGPHERLVRVADPAGNGLIVYESRRAPSGELA